MSEAQLSNLPVELLSRIACYLSLNECVKLERVNSVWRGVMLRQWERKTSFDFNKFIRANTVFRQAMDQEAKIEDKAEQHKNEQSTTKKQITRIHKPMATWLHSLCKKIGPHFKKIEIGSGANVLAKDIISEIISVGAPNLSTLDLKGVNPVQMERVPELQGITDLRIEFLSLEQEFDLDFRHAFKKLLVGLNNLKHFSFFLDGNVYRGSNCKDWLCDLIDTLASCLPFSLHSLNVGFCGMRFRLESVFALGKVHSKNLKVIHWLSDNVYDCVTMNALSFPNLEELCTVGVTEVHNLKSLKHLKKLSMCPQNRYSNLVETITSDDCEFRSSLLELSLVWDYVKPDESERFLLRKLALLPSLQSLAICGLPRAEADRVFGLRCIGESCSQLEKLKIFNAGLRDAELAVIASSFPKLTNLFQRPTMSLSDENISLEALQRFLSLIPSDRKMKIVFELGPKTDDVQCAGILTHYPNIDYSSMPW